MKTRDERKEESVFNASIKIINEEGLTNVSMSKIAKEAGVSPATLYIYYDSKTDLLLKVFLEARKRLFSACSQGVDPDGDVREGVMRFGRNIYQYIKEYPAYFSFLEQSVTSPLVMSMSEDDEVQPYSPQIVRLFNNGILKKELKDSSASLLIEVVYQLVARLGNDAHRSSSNLSGGYTLDELLVIAWDAVSKRK